LLENMVRGKTSIGRTTTDPGMVRLLAKLGFDWVELDMMFSANDWDSIDRLITTAEAAEITPIVRVQSNPDLGYDHRIAVEVSRAQGIGAQFIFVSHSCKKEIDESVLVSKGWHKRTETLPLTNPDEWESKVKQLSSETFVVPHAETKGAFEEMEDTLAIPGVKAFYFAMTDGSRALKGTEKPDWNLPKLWEYIDTAVKIGKKQDIMIGANTSYTPSFDELRKRVKKLHEHGVRMIDIQTSNFLFQISVGPFLDSIKKDLG
jgi:4-hydroxy-2-oxoheptanedioate aldolase